MNGHACCVLEVCCRKREESVKALAEELEHDFGWSAKKDAAGTGNAYAVAEWVFNHFDLVPKGLARAIVDAYEPHFAAKARKSE